MPTSSAANRVGEARPVLSRVSAVAAVAMPRTSQGSHRRAVIDAQDGSGRLRSADGAGDEEQAGTQLQDQVDQALVGWALTGARQVHGDRPANGEGAVGGEVERLVGLGRGERRHTWLLLPRIPD